MKPVFKKEYEMLEKELKVKLPRDIWRKGKKLYLDTTSTKPIIVFKVSEDLNKLYIHKNSIEELSEDKTKVKINGLWFYSRTFKEEAILYEDQLNKQERLSIDKTKECIEKYGATHEFRDSISGGKDSDISKLILDKAIKELNTDLKYKIDMFNSTNETAQTYLYVQNVVGLNKTDIHTPEKGWNRWLEEDKNYFLPSVMVRNCCATFKEGKLNKLLDKKKNYVLIVGTRSQESSKRSHHDWYLNEAVKKTGKQLNVPENWIRFLPIVKWSDIEVWLYIIRENLKFNPLYELGYNRVGCLICPYSSDYADFLTKRYFSLQWNRWMKMVEKNYEIWHVKRRLKWSLEEWKNGKWKQGTSKIQELIQKKPNEERINEVAKLLNISHDMASKYFKKTCSCGKKLNPGEVAMFLKTQGRYEGVEDDRQYLCKNCLCEVMNWSKEDYKEKSIQFSEQGCNLF
ncbi:phosphoadenosine phosphosulfate reductase domain-containing protein (plasmid) [Clostridium perfringens]